MATITSIHKRLGRFGAISVLAIVLLGLWLLRSSAVDKALPSLIGSKSRLKVTLRQGTYVGSEDGQSAPQVLEQFLGIPYGQSTAGERRFNEPLPVNPSRQTFSAKEYGFRCPNGASGGASEDCLNLNIYRPKKRPDGKKLPVLVHIYGGSFNFGWDRTRDIPNMVRWSTEPFIAITFNYRVGALGFLPSNLTASEGLLNAGLKDQALLLRWVQDNIAEFGGDPGDVTLMGSSAGAHSIGHHLMHDSSNPPPFAKLIIESGGPTARAVYTPSNPLHETQFQDLLTELGCEDMSEEQIIELLRQLPFQEISDASMSIFTAYNPSVRWPFQPVIDGPGGYIEEAPITAFRTGKFHKVPILTGFNTNEGAAFVPATTATGKQFTAFFHTLLPSLTDKDLATLNEVYPDPLVDPSSPYKDTRVDLGAQFKRTEAACGQFSYTCPVRHTARFAASSNVPVYLYHFAVNSTVKGGADHGTHNPFPTYNQDIRDFSDTIEEVAGSMHAYWTSFITTGDPNQAAGRFPKRPHWPIYEPEKGKLVVFGDGSDERAGGKSVGVAVEVRDDEFASVECQYWWDRTELFEV